jgi:uncharacterized protein (DUF305 family)
MSSVRPPASAARALRPLWLLLAAAVLLTGLAAALFTPRTPTESSREVRFVREMSQHHTQAIDMAARLYARTTDPDLHAVTLDILLAQSDQVGQMRGWLTLWGRPWAGAGMGSEHAAMMGMATPAQVSSLSSLPLPAAQRLFLTLMIRHHTGALGMVAPVLQGGVRPEVAALAAQIRATQTAEIRLMKTLLAGQGGAVPVVPAAPAGMPGMTHP